MHRRLVVTKENNSRLIIKIIYVRELNILKKVICSSLILLILLTSMMTIVFAESVTSSMYGEMEEHANTESNIPNEFITTSNMLPQTGGIPAEVFYGLGGIFLLSSACLLCINAKLSKKQNL